ncbi:MAG: hypothetical protein IJV73_04845, partial [Clostridia bacterium]|nr:hypothetical protein [Clostridia bacterium]
TTLRVDDIHALGVIGMRCHRAERRPLARRRQACDISNPPRGFENPAIGTLITQFAGDQWSPLQIIYKSANGIKPLVDVLKYS